MSYQQTASQSETAFHNRSSSNMYTQSQARAARESQAQPATFPQAAQTDASAMSQMMNQFASFSMPGANLASAAALGAGQFYYNPADNTIMMAPAMYPAPQLGPGQLPETGYSSYASTMPYISQGAYSGYLGGFPIMPYTPSRATSGYYPDRADQFHKEVPGLENRRSSYSTTNESAPGTPNYGPLLHHEQGTQIAAVNRSPFGSTPSPQQLPIQHADQHVAKSLAYKTIPINVDLDALVVQHPPIPRAVPAVFTPRESMRTLDQSLSNPIPGNRNVYIRGLHPQTDDETLAAYAKRFGKVETSKAIIDTATGACKGFGFAKYEDVRDSELCIRGFYKLGYEVGFARESFNSRLKAEGDEQSTNLYVSNLPKNMTEAELGAIFMDYTVLSSRILRDERKNSRGVGFARFESRDVCEEIIKNFHGQPIGEEGLLLQVRYADTPAQKDLKRITTERRQFRTNEYNVGAYGAPAELLALSPVMPSPLVPRTSQIARHLPVSRASGSWKRDSAGTSSGGSISNFKDIDRHDRHVKLSLTEATPNKNKDDKVSSSTPTISEDGSNEDTVHNDSPAIVHGGASQSPSVRKS
ncbi:uncharacterized protein LY89DRAFT_602320 [Mollisia scopiformis]|uniref:RRM domain-containing protein n=1 Tax=Mollisia scopiformis TaxID=149040 RepID=A0A132B4Y5_MOLSC|nr:uncharacterized protein LY89DRAFT_602320 [Mollisia scopiformis]KUJ06954.1 hypothetical protein LY89DRAFT_602320 [Mollisia scopiformis]